MSKSDQEEKFKQDLLNIIGDDNKPALDDFNKKGNGFDALKFTINRLQEALNSESKGISPEKIQKSAKDQYVHDVNLVTNNLPYDKKEQFLSALSEHYPGTKALNEQIKQSDKERDEKLDQLIDECSTSLAKAQKLGPTAKLKQENAIAQKFANQCVNLVKGESAEDTTEKKQMEAGLLNDFKSNVSPKQSFLKSVVNFCDKFGLKGIANQFRKKIDIEQHKQSAKQIFDKMKDNLQDKSPPTYTKSTPISKQTVTGKENGRGGIS